MAFTFPAPALELTDLETFNAVWPDYTTFHADLTAEFSTTPLFDFAHMDSQDFWLWFWKGLEDSYKGTYTAYETAAAFKLHFYGTIVSEAPYFFKAFQLYNHFMTTNNNTVAHFEQAETETTTRAKDETVARTGTDNTFTKTAETPTDFAPNTTFANNYTNAQSNTLLTKGTTDTIDDDETLNRDKKMSVEEIFARFNEIKSSELDRLIQAFSKHFVNVFVSDFAE